MENIIIIPFSSLAFALATISSDGTEFVQFEINIKWKIITMMFLVLKPCITIVKLI